MLSATVKGVVAIDPQKLCKGCFGEKNNAAECPVCGYSKDTIPGSPLHLKPGTILENKYLVGRVLGQGGFGITYLAWDINLNIKLAIKEYFPQQLATRAQGQANISAYTGSLSSQYAYGLDKFLQEARTLARFEGHPNIVSVRDFFKANGTAYFVMSYVEGITLKDYLENSGGKMSFTQAKKVIFPVLDALREVHSAGILHRDISPDNIYINTKGQVVLLDFGAARQAVGEKGKSLSIILKPGYAPEEQYRSKGVQGAWTDIYATAATLYHLVTGLQPPEALERLSEDPLIPPGETGVAIENHQEQALIKALAVRGPDRFQCVREFQDALLGISPAESAAGPGERGPEHSPEKVLNQADPFFSSTENRTSPNPPLAPPDWSSPDPHRSASGSSPAVKPEKKKQLSKGAIIGGGIVLLAVASILITWISSITGEDNTFADGEATTENRPGLEETESQLDSGRTETDQPTKEEEVPPQDLLEEGSIFYDGGSYRGQLQNDLPHGQGEWANEDGDSYEGEWEYGLFHGWGKRNWANGDSYEGEWEDDMIHGWGTYTWANGDRYEGEWQNALRNGLGTYTFANGTVHTGEYKDDGAHGWGIEVFPDGSSYEGEYRYSVFHGRGTYIFGSGTEWAGDIYKGEFENGMFHGQGVYTFADGSILDGSWNEGDFVD